MGLLGSPQRTTLRVKIGSGLKGSHYIFLCMTEGRAEETALSTSNDSVPALLLGCSKLLEPQVLF